MEDENLATHAKAHNLFLKKWENLGLHVIALDGTADANAEAK